MVRQPACIELGVCLWYLLAKLLVFGAIPHAWGISLPTWSEVLYLVK